MQKNEHFESLGPDDDSDPDEWSIWPPPPQRTEGTVEAVDLAQAKLTCLKTVMIDALMIISCLSNLTWIFAIAGHNATVPIIINYLPPFTIWYFMITILLSAVTLSVAAKSQSYRKSGKFPPLLVVMIASAAIPLGFCLVCLLGSHSIR